MTTSERVAVLLWLYGTELSQEFLSLLIPIKDYIHLYLGLCHETSRDTEDQFKLFFDNNYLTVQYFENKGGDTRPFLHQLADAKKYYKQFIKIHSKKSRLGFKYQVNWRSLLLDSLLRKNNFVSIRDQLSTNKYDMIGCKSLILKNQEYKNHPKILELCDILKLEYNKFKYKKFVAGNMFAGNISAFDIFIDNIEILDYLLSFEINKVDDTDGARYVHSLERLFGYVCSMNYNIGYPIDKHIRIITPKIPKHKLSLIKLYTGDCYISENINIYGKIIEEKKNQYLDILWLNQDSNIITKYGYISDNTITNIAYF